MKAEDTFSRSIHVLLRINETNLLLYRLVTGHRLLCNFDIVYSPLDCRIEGGRWTLMWYLLAVPP